MNPAPHVRPAVAGDISRILEIERETEAAAHFAESDYRQALASVNPGADVHRIVLVAEMVAWVQGFLVARLLHEEWEIENVVVEKAARQKGFGASLLRAFLQSYTRSQYGSEGGGAESKAVFLEVRESNRAARKLYEKFGFSIAGRRAAYYRNPHEDAILYRYYFEQDRKRLIIV